MLGNQKKKKNTTDLTNLYDAYIENERINKTQNIFCQVFLVS